MSIGGVARRRAFGEKGVSWYEKFGGLDGVDLLGWVVLGVRGTGEALTPL